jgi:hypothetical protein
MITLSKLPKKCQNCGKDYIQRSLRQKYCGDFNLKTGCSSYIRKEDLKKYLISYVKTNKKSLLAKNKIWRKENATVLKEKKQLYYRSLHPLKIKHVMTAEERIVAARARNKKYYYKHRDRLMKKKNEGTQKRIKSDVGYRILIRMRFRLWHALKNQKAGRTTLTLLGCDMPTLKSHLEKQFLEGMNWDNYGKKGWTIDHKFPLSKANLNNEAELKRVCHYTNLQPLWDYDNTLKGNRI